MSDFSLDEPDPPEVSGLTWRRIGREDLAALVELAARCRSVDGGLGFLFEPDFILKRYFPDAPGAALGAFDPHNHLVACSTVHLDPDPETQLAKIAGLVSPDLRNRGLGTYLLRWSLFQARALSGRASGLHPVLQIATESLTAPADRLYRAYGFEPVFEELVMERDLGLPLAEFRLPPGLTFKTWTPDLAGQFYQTYYAAFKERPGFPGWSATGWISEVIDDDLVPEWTLLAVVNGEPAGFVIGDADLTTDPPGGYISQVGVVPAWRRRGIASALLAETMRRMQADGAASALLTVHTNNPGAIQAYSRLGFVTIGRRARYQRAA